MKKRKKTWQELKTWKTFFTSMVSTICCVFVDGI